MPQRVAFGRDRPEGGDDEPAQRLKIGIFRQLKSERAIEIGDGHAGVDLDGTVVDAVEVVGGGAFVFIGDVADDFFEDVFGGDEAGGAAVFVEDDGEVPLAVAEFAQEIAEGFGAGNEHGRSHDGAKVDGGMRAIGGEERQQVFGVENADNVVEGAFVNGNA